MQKDIIGYEDEYAIDESGNIYSKRNNIFLAHAIKKVSGYHTIGLYRNGKGKKFRVHRLVAIHFIPNPKELPQVDHIDENKSNNHVSNLRWCTGKENATWFYENNKDIINSGNKSKSCIVDGIQFSSAYQAGKYIYEKGNRGSIDTISREIKRRNLKHGHTWMMYGKYSIGY